MSKGNIRSFRYSDKVAEILESYEGKSLNEKFENLVLYCFDAIPKVRTELQQYQRMIEDKKNAYTKVCTQLSDIRDLMRTLEVVQRYGEVAADKAKNLFADEV